MGDDKWVEQEKKFQNDMKNLKVPYHPCMTLTVTVLRGTKISVGFFHDFFDTPDTQVYVKCEGAFGQKCFKTKAAKNSHNPEWNEDFTFVISPDANAVTITVDVFEEDRFKHDPHLGAGVFETNDLELDHPKSVTLDMGKHGKIDLELLKRWRTKSDYRLSLGLSDEEREYRIKRKPKTMEALQKILGADDGPKSLNETPTIAVAVTGGGYRAVANTCGAMEALAENGLVDSLMYIAGLSGSSWYISTSYLHQSMKNLESLIAHHDWLRHRMEKSLTKCLFDISFHKRYREYKEFKTEHLQPTTFVDFYGFALGETFLGKEMMKTPLSSLRNYVKTAEVPFPILTCAHVRDNLPMSAFWDEMEMSPIEVSLPSYGINIPTEKFNSKWANGIQQKVLPEPPLHYLMGASASAFAILFSRISDKNEIDKGLQEYLDEFDQSHQNEAADGEDPESEDEDLDDAPPTSLRKKGAENFASPDDQWIEKIEETASSSKLSEVHTASGRGLILDRTAKVKNCSTCYYDLKKFRFNTEPVTKDIEASARISRKMSTKKAHISLCDSALGCNLPSIHVVRPQRTVDVLIVVDCSNYQHEDSLMLELFATVQAQAYDHGIKFPRISLEKIAEDRFREFYLFEDPDDPECPVVLWFTLANGRFKELEQPHRRPGYPTPDRDDSGKEKFNDFSVFPESSDFGTFRLSFTPLNFDRLRELMRFNIMSNMWVVKEKIANKVKQLRKAR